MKKTLIIIFSIIAILILLGIFANYYDGARVRAGVEPKLTIKTYSEEHDAVIYWGLGYKVVRYIGVSPNELYETAVEVKMGSWFMPYGLTEYPQIEFEKVDTGKGSIVSKYQDIKLIYNLLENQRYENEVCEGIVDYKITIENNTYTVKSSCNGIVLNGKEANISEDEMNSILKIFDSEITNQDSIKINRIDEEMGMARLDIDVKSKQIDSVENEYVFIDELNKKYEFEGIGAYYIRENLESEEYNILKDYVISYKEFRLSFSKGSEPLRDYFYKEDNLEISIINGIEVMINEYEGRYMVTFEKDDIYFDIETNSNMLSESEVVDLIGLLLK